MGLRFAPATARELLATLSKSASGVATIIQEQPEVISKWHMVLVPDTPHEVSSLSSARYGRLRCLRNSFPAASKQNKNTYDYSDFNLNAYSATLLWRNFLR